jgi:translation initiation factor 1A
MGKNRKGGKKFKRNKKFSLGMKHREMVYKQSDQLYAILEENKGNLRFNCVCDDNKPRFAHVPGSFHKRVWFRKDDVVLVSVREFQPDKCDILYKYNQSEIEILKSQNLFPYLLDYKPDMEDFVESDSESDSESESESETENENKKSKNLKITDEEFDAI